MNKNLNGYKQWTVRAGDWYNSERRIIFATRTKKEKQKWLQYFKKETKQMKMEDLKNNKPHEENIIGKDLSPDYDQDILDLRLKGSKLSTKFKIKNQNLEINQHSRIGS